MLRPAIAFIYLFFCLETAETSDSLPDFSREVLPILSNKCFVCHGPDAKKDELRLDSREGAFRDLGGYRAIDPDKPEESELLVRIHDASDPMPPRDAEKQLTPAEREILGRWIRGGGEYKKHWAFVEPQKPAGGVSIDSLVEEKLPPGITLAGTASRANLARRAGLVLTGLPPEPDQLRRYLEDSSPQGYERLIDELLASPRFGEHQARYWLDAVRYGDTHGLHLDNRRGIFPYRDWVVKAFNDNLPFDQFITWQLAGDLLPNPSLEQLVATGFVRMNPTTSEGGAIPEEFLAKNNFDRTENFGTVFLGMTLNCARCHTHKYDPISQREYFELFAFFHNTAESPLDGNAYTYAPVVEVPATRQAWNRWSEIEKRRDDILGKIDQIVREKNIEPAAAAYAKETLGWQNGPWQVSTSDQAFSVSSLDEKNWKNIADPADLKKENFGDQDQAKWVRFTLTSPREQVLIYQTNASEGSELDGQTTRYASIRLKAGENRYLAKLRGVDGKIRAEVKIQNPWETLAKSGNWDQSPKLDRILMAGDPSTALFPEALQKAAEKLGNQMLANLEHFTTTLVARDLPKPRETRLLERGEYDMAKGPVLEPAVFAVMNPYPVGAPKNRLGLSQWLTDPKHPLVTRVLVNRIWQNLMGEGLSRSPEDFGLQGKQPTHPRLLDGLAVSFREEGWNYKQLVRSIVTSRVFLQDSAWRTEVNDPENLLWARGPSFRLDAEVIRDTGLWASGLLLENLGGEGVKPWQPEGMWAALAHPASNTRFYVPDTGDRINQRSLYIYWKRTSPHPMMTLFDAPSRESSCVRRSRGTTPLQSLGLLNEPQRLDMSRHYAKHLVQEFQTDEERLVSVFSALTCRPPDDAEKKACLTLLDLALKRYHENAADARSLARSDDSETVASQAAWTQVVSTILASDLTILLY